MAHSWSLVVATYNRIATLKFCVELALRQTRPPAEVVIVDAGPGWEENARIIGEVVAASGGAVPLRYLRSETPSLTVQRNIGVQAASSDVLFLIDDDSLMFPDCAAEIMRVYDEDEGRRIDGVQAVLWPVSPLAGIAPGRKKDSGTRFLDALMTLKSIRVLKNRVLAKYFFMAVDSIFIPYDGMYFYENDQAAPVEGVSLQRLFHGCRMTFRRKAVLQEPFDDLLRFYCPFEDLDASYRVSRHGLLVTAPKARLHHYESASGRLNRYRVTLLASLNQAVLIRRHALPVEPAMRRFFHLARRRIAAEFVKDLASRRLDFPQFRAMLKALPLAREAFRIDEAALHDWYLGLQDMIVKDKI